MADCQVRYIKRDNGDPDYRIQGIGGDGGTGWYMEVDDAIRHIEEEWNTFFVMVNGRRVNVIVDIHPVSRRKFLTTEADGYPLNNLLSLPECPPFKKVA